MSLVDLVMPKMGESIMEATILKWNKLPGDAVKQDETVLEIATDKVDSEVPSITQGTLEEILYQVNDVVPIGAVIARIRTAAAASAASADGGQSLAPAGASRRRPRQPVPNRQPSRPKASPHPLTHKPPHPNTPHPPPPPTDSRRRPPLLLPPCPQHRRQ